MKTNINNIKIKKRDNASSTEKEKFIEMVNSIDDCYKRTVFLDDFLAMSVHDESFYNIIEDLIYNYYGEWKGDLICWWIFNRLDEEGNLIPINVSIEGEEEKEIKIATADKLWNLIKKISKTEENGKTL
jgi:hypothetical protein